MRPRSLRQALARQWMLFTAMLSALWLGTMLLLLFVLEDSFIDRRLRAVAATVQDPVAAPASLPAQFRILPFAALPADVAARLSDAKSGSIREFRRGDGRYVHVLWTQAGNGQSFVLLYDVTDELTVNPGLSRGMLYALALLGLLLALAYALAWAFAQRVSRRAEELVQQVLDSRDPQQLIALSMREPVQELGELMRRHADAWKRQLAAVESERQTLAFLGHELRTPLQSARTSLALLMDDRTNDRAWARLERALARLTRASRAVLWLSSDPMPSAAQDGTPALACVRALAGEFAALAEARGQRLEVAIPAGLHWSAPREVVETLLANLMLNAIQHGAHGGTLRWQADDRALTLCNPVSESEHAGFGLGLQVVHRLAQRIGWTVALAHEGAQMMCTVTWPSPAPSSPAAN